MQRLAAYIGEEDARFRYKTMIPCNLYGGYDAFDPRRSHLAAAVIDKLHKAKASGQTSVAIWGDGTARREFLYAGDLADAVLRAVERFDTLPPVMNVGAGTDHAVNDYYRVAAEVTGYTGAFSHDLTKPVGMKRKRMDIGLARDWGWTAPTSLRDGLAKTYEFYLTHVAATAA